jgi:LPS-assembly protein
MTRRAGLHAGALAFSLVLVTAAGAIDERAEVRVLSGPGAVSTVTVHARPEVKIEDQTPGARGESGPRGPASTGETFTDEVTLVLRDFTIPRPAAIEVGDPVVSAVRLFPDPAGTRVIVFIRQPVTYSVSRPSGIGEVRIELRGRARPLVVETTPLGKRRFERPKPQREGEVAVDAETLSYDQQTNTLTARGGVTLTRGDTTLTADEVVYDRTNGIAEARGHVVLTDPQATVEGESARLDMDDETGWVDGATIDLRPSDFQVRGGHIEKLGGPRYSVANGVFTTCRCGGLEKPSWSIGGSQTDVKLQGWGLVRGATFRIKDVPVLWVPYLAFPANTTRQTGFLIPRVGFSNRRGFQYEQPFYWAINKSSDATVAVDIQTEARLGILGEYRYALSKTARGAFSGSYYSEQIRGDTKGTLGPRGEPADIPENRFGVSGYHRQRFYGKSRFYLDLFAVSDDLFLREINSFAFSNQQDLALRSTRFTTSRTGVHKGWADGLVQGEFMYHQDLVDPQELALQKLPRIEAEHTMPVPKLPLVGRLAGEAVDFQRQEGFDGLRADLAPELLLPFRLGRVLNGSVKGTLRETAYHLTNDEQVALVLPARTFRVAPELPRLDQNRTQESAEVRARTGTEFARVFDFRHFGLEKVKHTLEPEAQYFYVPQVSRPIFDVELPPCQSLSPGSRQPGVNCDGTLFSEGYLFDERDAVNRRNFFSYGLTTRLLTRAAAPGEPPAPEEKVEDDDEEVTPEFPAPEVLPQGLPGDALPRPAPRPTAGAATPPREFLRASVVHGYDVSRPLVGDSHLSDLDFSLRLTPLDYLSFAYDTTFGVVDSAFRGLSLGAVLREPGWSVATVPRFQAPSAIGISYRFIEKSANRPSALSPLEQALFATGGLNEIDGSLYLRLGDYVGFTFLARYDLNTTQLPTEELGPHFLERNYFLRLISRCQCWMVEGGMSDKTNPDERLFRVQLTLLGLGSFGRSPSARNYVGFAPLAGLRRPASSATGGLY